MKIVFATNNAHKLSEVSQALGEAFTLVTPRECGITEDIPENEPTLEGNASTLKSIVASLQEQLAQVEARLEEMKARRNDLAARGEAAKEKKRTNQTLREAEGSDFARRFEELQARIERWEAEAKACAPASASKSTRQTFEDMEKDKAIDDELAALKAAMTREDQA